MSGHSKWAQIKYKKAASDAKRGKLFSKISRIITIAARESGGDPKTNSKLAAAIEEARKANMPSDSIERAIKKASAKESAELKEVVYEAYGPGGVALIIEGYTDSHNRTTQEIKHLLSQSGSALANQGAASWAFSKVDGRLEATTTVEISEEDGAKLSLLVDALEEHDDVSEVYTNAA